MHMFLKAKASNAIGSHACVRAKPVRKEKLAFLAIYWNILLKSINPFYNLTIINNFNQDWNRRKKTFDWAFLNKIIFYLLYYYHFFNFLFYFKFRFNIYFKLGSK